MKENILFQEGTGKLRVLYKCSLILQDETKTERSVLEEIVTLLPEAWQYPENVGARIIWNGSDFKSPNYIPSKYRQYQEFTTKNKLQGAVEIVYQEEYLEEIEALFLEEEHELLCLVANMVGSYLNRIQARQIEAYQHATINNTTFLIWSVNREYELMSFNIPYIDFVYKKYGVRPKLGNRVTENASYLQSLRKRWIPRYERALAGETFKIKSVVDEHTFEYTLSPIVEKEKIIGVAVFGEDVSERVKLEKEMLDVNKRLSETRLMALRAAMNPHFVFNCMSSIQYYILKNDQKSAVTYLSKFSKLMRATLDNSVMSKGRLSETIETVKLYIELEALRFENKFDLFIDVNSKIDIDNVEIPSLLIQPYVENAIVHGLYNKKGKGELKISFSLENKNKLLVEIKDNGIGRKAAFEQRLLKHPKHKSLGVALTEERLKIFNEGEDTPVEIIDLETDGIPSGTLVKIWIKI